MALTAQQITGLNAAAARKAAGTANAADLQNLNYATTQGYKAPAASPTPPQPIAPKPPTVPTSPAPTGGSPIGNAIGGTLRNALGVVNPLANIANTAITAYNNLNPTRPPTTPTPPPTTSTPLPTIGNKAASPTTNIKPPTTTLAPAFKAPTNFYRVRTPGQPDAFYNATTHAYIGPTQFGTGAGFKEVAAPSSAVGGSSGGSTQSGGTGTSTNPPPQPGQNPPSPPGTLSSVDTNAPLNSTLPALDQGGLYGQLIAALAGKAAGPNPDYTKQLATANQYNQQLQDLRSQEAQALANNALNPIPLEFQQGRGQVLQTQYGQREAALGSAFQGASNLVNAANTQQGIQTQGLGTAAGLLTPQLGQYGQAQYSPLGGLVGGGTGGTLNPLNNLSSLAQQVISGQLTPSAAYALGGSVPNFAGALNAEIQRQSNGSFNTQTAEGAGAATSQRAQIGGTGAVQANQQVYNNALSAVADLTARNNNVKSFGQQVLQNMTANGINPTASQWVNKTLNQILTQFNAPQYAQFNANIQGLQARVSDLLQTGEIPSAATAGAQEIANGNITLGAMQSTLNQLTNEGDALVRNKQAVAQQAYNNMTGGGGGGGGTGGPIDWNAVLNYGQ